MAERITDMLISDHEPRASERGTMNTPSEYGKPFSKETVTKKKEVRMVLTQAQVTEALALFLTKRFPQFRNMKIAFDVVNLNHEYEGIEFGDFLIEAVAFREITE